MFRLVLTALMLGAGAWCAGRASRRAAARRLRDGAAMERWEGEGGAIR
jgi:hypothetical protein